MVSWEERNRLHFPGKMQQEGTKKKYVTVPVLPVWLILTAAAFHIPFQSLSPPMERRDGNELKGSAAEEELPVQGKLSWGNASVKVGSVSCSSQGGYASGVNEVLRVFYSSRLS